MNRKFFSLALGVAALGLWAGNALAGDGPGVVDACGPEGCGHGVCRAVTATRKVPERCYSSGCEDFCLPKCGLFGGHKHCADDTGDCAGSCEHVRTRKYLVVKIHQKEECYPKCVVDGQACAGNHSCPAHVEDLPRPAQSANLQPVPVKPVTTLPAPARPVTAPQRLSPYATYQYGK